MPSHGAGPGPPVSCDEEDGGDSGDSLKRRDLGKEQREKASVTPELETIFPHRAPLQTRCCGEGVDRTRGPGGSGPSQARSAEVPHTPPPGRSRPRSRSGRPGRQLGCPAGLRARRWASLPAQLPVAPPQPPLPTPRLQEEKGRQGRELSPRPLQDWLSPPPTGSALAAERFVSPAIPAAGRPGAPPRAPLSRRLPLLFSPPGEAALPPPPLLPVCLKNLLSSEWSIRHSPLTRRAERGAPW